MSEEVKVVIIGAGAAGLAAGCRLLEKGFSDFTIIEASNRIGGRLHTIPFGKGWLDLGAEWVHGEKGNVVFEDAIQYDLLYESDSPFEKSLIFRSNGETLQDDVALMLIDILDDIVDHHPGEIRAYKGSLGDFFVEKYWPRVNPLIETGKLTKRDADDCLIWLEHVENSIDGSPSWYKTSADEAIEYVKLPGAVLNTWKLGGYSTVLDLLTKKIPNPSAKLKIEEKVRLGKEVTNVNWSESKVLVSCADGSQFKADHVVTTVSLNVLKAVAQNLFVPSLPAQHLNAIKGLGMGTVDKIFLEFPYRWWKPGTAGVSLMWRSEDAANVPKELEWTTGVLGFYVEDNHPLSVMCGWIVGRHAEAMERASDEEVLRECMALLRRFVGPTVPQATAVRRTQWFTNPYVRGSYSCRMVESNTMDVWPRHIAQPINNSSGKPVLLFAGEATHDHFFSTVHGAIETGWREADRILSLQKTVELKYDVAIVGAGVAGLAAANQLTAAGLKVIVLEANSTAGGRVKSINTNAGWVELGAQWLHGEDTEVFQIASQSGLISNVVSAEGQGHYYRPDGTVIPSQMVGEMDQVVTQLLQNCEEFHKNRKYPKSIGSELDEKFTEYLKNKNPVEHTDLEALFQWNKRFQIIDNSCDDLSKLSAKSWGLYNDCGKSHCINFKSSFSSLIDTLMKSLPSDTVHFNSPVSRIEWVDTAKSIKDHRAKVVCSKLTVLTDYVIVTSSLGYLKEHKDSMFVPKLPLPLSKAIELLGFGTIAKIFLEYDKPWWKDGDKGFQFVWKENKLLNEIPWGAGLTGFDVMKGKPILLGWIGGPSASIVEKLPENKLKEQITLLLKNFTRLNNLPEPKCIYRSKWHSDEFVRGSYCHVTSACDAEDINCGSLSQPVVTRIRSSSQEKEIPTILLAGEACHKTHYSTVHGAYESGKEQAQVIINSITRNQSAKL